MRTELFFPPEASDERKAVVRATFGDRGLAIAHEGRPAIKAIDIPGVRLDAAFILAASAFVEGLLFEAEKELLKRGIQALREVWQTSGTVTIDTDGDPGQRIPTTYLIPSGDAGDAAFDAIDGDYASGATGQRFWLRSLGWGSKDDLDRIQDEINRAREDASSDSGLSREG